MAIFCKISRKTTGKKKEGTFLWEEHLHEFENGKTTFIPVEAFGTSLLGSFGNALKEGVLFETKIKDYEKSCDGVEVRWFARIEKVCGYRILAQFVGSNEKFWVNFFSDEIHSITHALTVDPDRKEIVYCPPSNLNEEYQNDMANFISNTIEGEVVGQMSLSHVYDKKQSEIHKSRFRVGQRLELLNYNNSTEIRVARVQAICGRRINVLVTKKDFPQAFPEDDRQVQTSDAQYWIDEASFFIFPVGWAAVNGYNLNAKKDYIEHTKKIAERIRKGEVPGYERDDVKFEDLPKTPVDKEKWKQLKVGQKFELIDPLAQQFKTLHVASILKFCKTEGYMIVGMDGPDALEDSFPVHIDNNFMFPVGYAEKHDLTLESPEGFKGIFSWSSYMKKEKAEALPLELFKPMPSAERLNMFKAGMRLEAADMCENQLICPATIKSVHGRIINVNFDGWDDEFDELYDIDSHDILPIGWCELHDYTLQFPRS